MDQLMEANTINNKVEEEDYETYMAEWWSWMTKKKHRAWDTMHKKCYNGWRRGRHRIGNTKDINGYNDANNTPKKLGLLNMSNTKIDDTVDI
jgi:hypothetical protein